MIPIESARSLDDAERTSSRAAADAELLTSALEYFRAGRHAQAAAAYAEFLEHEPSHAVCLHHLGLIAHQRGDHAAAAQLIEQALSIKHDYVEALSNLAAIRRALGDTQASIAAAQQAIILAPEFAQAHSNLGNALEDQGLLDAALAAYRKAALLNPGFVEAHTNCANVLRKLGRAEEAAAVCEEVITQRPDAAYSHGLEDRSELGQRLRQAFDEFVDIRAMRDDEAAGRIKSDRIDILVELKGYTKGARTGISARKAAPVQVSFVGFPGTMGASFIDYIIADPFVLPMDQQAFFSEKIVHLPNCYQPNDTKRLISNVTPTRGECGLPEQGFVFCSFNNTYKITPASSQRHSGICALALGCKQSCQGQSSPGSRRTRG
jgi:predicted O-linked N-acetylglucosamine transferase (SPINDLY family)